MMLKCRHNNGDGAGECRSHDVWQDPCYERSWLGTGEVNIHVFGFSLSFYLLVARLFVNKVQQWALPSRGTCPTPRLLSGSILHCCRLRLTDDVCICKDVRLRVNINCCLSQLVNRQPPFGNHLQDSISHLPRYELHVQQVTTSSFMITPLHWEGK